MPICFAPSPNPCGCVSGRLQLYVLRLKLNVLRLKLNVLTPSAPGHSHPAHPGRWRPCILASLPSCSRPPQTFRLCWLFPPGASPLVYNTKWSGRSRTGNPWPGRDCRVRRRKLRRYPGKEHLHPCHLSKFPSGDCHLILALACKPLALVSSVIHLLSSFPLARPLLDQGV